MREGETKREGGAEEHGVERVRREVCGQDYMGLLAQQSNRGFIN